jgi:glycosyltransferase involved in cell wall biosynthesis
MSLRTGYGDISLPVDRSGFGLRGLSGSENRAQDRVRPRRRRLLFLTYAFPPMKTIGCVRAYNIAKWLTRRGWEVTAVTPYEAAWGPATHVMELHEDFCRQGIRCIRTPHHWRSLLPIPVDRRKHFLSWTAGGVCRRVAAICGIEREAGWIADAAKACAGLTPDDVDVILASGPPFGSFDLARRLAERLERPFVLDYRDLWAGNPYAKRSARSGSVKKESELLAASTAVIGISPSLAESLRNQFGLTRTVNVITNGFDPEESGGIPRLGFGHFAIVYTGQFYPPKSTVDPLMAALRKIDRAADSQMGWAFHYYGYQGEYVRRVARDFGVEHRVVIGGRVPRSEALAAVRGANIAVVISSVYEEGSLQDKGVVTGKVFEAVGLGTPLLVIAPDGSDLEGILEVTGLGKRFSGTQIDQIAAFLRDVMRGRVPGAINSDSYSWSTISLEFDRVLREALASRR